MAIAFRSQTGITGTGTSLAITKPSGAVNGDVHLLLFLIDSASVSPTLPGWQTIRSESDATKGYQAFLAWRREDGSAFSGLTWTGTLYAGAVVLDYSGCRLRGIPVGAHSGQVNAASASIDAPSVTPGRDVSRLVYVASDDYGGNVTRPAGFTDRDVNGYDMQASDKALSTGAATGTVTGTHTSNRSIGQLLVLIPEEDPGPRRSLLGAGW